MGMAHPITGASLGSLCLQVMFTIRSEPTLKPTTATTRDSIPVAPILLAHRILKEVGVWAMLGHKTSTNGKDGT